MISAGGERYPAARDQRLAIFLPDLGGGGAERVALALLQGFLDSGHPVDLVLALRQGVLLPMVPSGVEIIDLGAARLRQAVLPLVRYLRERRPHALHAMMWPLPLLAIVARRLAQVDTRIIGSEHTTLSARPHGLRHRAVRALTRQAYMRADGLVGVSAGVADDLSTFVGVPRDRITVIHNPLLLPATLPDPATMAGRWPAGTKRILAVGSLKAEKNYPLLLRALARVRESVPASLLILGDGPLRVELERQITDKGLGDAVVIAGFDTDPWPYYTAADLFVLSSDCEGFGNVLVEALHAGLPIVSTDCPNGPREILDDGEYGTLVPCNDERLLAAAIQGALRGHHNSGVLRNRGRMLASQIDKHIDVMLR
ncbi:Glycosyltransferase involved in cell wall bisynthesis [Sphingomonas gellani]|uniref:Glycosyltransferase involved in cell wall bisynthesis n=1 Tax=Sphingomonas gellani TaxID=1166340 RepID=A0A1H8I3V9_9SPHN|nr:glycosyltransferase [Sphingomonas gellani]SEN62857.1 Glycosyltransferase involved in cell wall bisynthesis [Sphingomonas gellani]